MPFCENVLRCLKEEEEEEHKTNQNCVGAKELFWGYVATDWEGVNFQCKKRRRLNRTIIVKKCEGFCNQY